MREMLAADVEGVYYVVRDARKTMKSTKHGQQQGDQTQNPNVLLKRLGWRGRWFSLLGLGWRFRHLAFNLRSLSYHEYGLLTGHLQDLELFWRAFLSPSGLVTVGVGHLT